MSASPPLLETARLKLRRLAHADAPFIVRLLNDASFLRYIGDRGVRTEEDARRYLDRGPLASYRERGFGLYLVAVKESGLPAGICGLLKRDTLPDVDLGFAFLPDFRSLGYATESARAVLEHGRTLGMGRIVAVTTPDNAGSIRVLQKLGLRAEGTLRLSEGEPELQLFAPAPRVAARIPRVRPG